MLTAVLSLLAAAVAPAVAMDARAPSEIVEAAPTGEWTAIAPRDLLVMDLAPDRDGKPRRVVIQLMPPPFSQGWIGNIRTLAAAHWWDGTSVNRVQDIYVVQWGDANGEDRAKARPIPTQLRIVGQDDYTARILAAPFQRIMKAKMEFATQHPDEVNGHPGLGTGDSYAMQTLFDRGWPLADDFNRMWPVHCYGTVGVGRDMPPDTGSGAELYAVIGQAPRHLDRNIAVVGRVIEGIEHLSSLPRGTGPLGFYQTAAERVPIVSVRIGDQVPGLPRYEYLSTESASFARYADARANRRDAFFVVPAGGVDICNVPVPARRVKG